MATFALAMDSRHLLLPWVMATVLWGLGVSMTFPLLVAAALQSIPSHLAATGSAVNQTFRQFGGVLGVALLAAVLGSLHGRPAFEVGWSICALAAASTCLLGWLSKHPCSCDD
jgi:predicted MFS family arabinose efflux permease